MLGRHRQPDPRRRSTSRARSGRCSRRWRSRSSCSSCSARSATRRPCTCGSARRTPFEGLRSTSVVTIGYGPGDDAVGGLGVSARPGWTTPAPSARCAPSPATSAICWPRAEPLMAPDYYGMLGVAGTPPTTRSRRPTASWPASCTPTSTRTRRRRSSSRRSPRPTRCCPTRRSGRSSTSAATRSRRAAAAAARRRRRRFGGFGDIMDAFFGGAGGARGPRAADPAGRRRDAAARARPGRDGVRRRRARSPSTPPSSARTCTGAGTAAGHPPDDLRHLPRPRRGAVRCSGRSSARS